VALLSLDQHQYLLDPCTCHQVQLGPDRLLEKSSGPAHFRPALDEARPGPQFHY